MDITFKYNGKIISTPNLEKKLKRMKISIDDIEIIENPVKKKEEDSKLDDWMIDKEQVIVRCKLDDIRRVYYVPKGTHPPIVDKHGIYSKEQLENMYYEN